MRGCSHWGRGSGIKQTFLRKIFFFYSETFLASNVFFLQHVCLSTHLPICSFISTAGALVVVRGITHPISPIQVTTYSFHSPLCAIFLNSWWPLQSKENGVFLHSVSVSIASGLSSLSSISSVRSVNCIYTYKHFLRRCHLRLCWYCSSSVCLSVVLGQVCLHIDSQDFKLFRTYFFPHEKNFL